MKYDLIKFQVGDKVKLSDYSGFGDYEAHEGEVGTIESIGPEGNIHITWSDGGGSTYFFDRSEDCWNQDRELLYAEVPEKNQLPAYVPELDEDCGSVVEV